MNKYKDMSNTELLKLLLKTVPKETPLSYVWGEVQVYVDTEDIVNNEVFKEILSRMIPRESIKLTVK